MGAIFKNIRLSNPANMAEMIAYRSNRVISQSLLKRSALSMVLFAMDQGEEISDETVPGAQWIWVLEGRLSVSIEQEPFELAAGNHIIVPPRKHHALVAPQPCKMLQINLEEDRDMPQGEFLRKIPVGQVINLAEQIDCEPHQIASLSLAQQKNVIITLFALDQDEEMGGHASTGDAMVCMLEGCAQITIGDETHTVEAGQSIVMPANVQHALKAVTAYKMLLIVVKP